MPVKKFRIYFWLIALLLLAAALAGLRAFQQLYGNREASFAENLQCRMDRELGGIEERKNVLLDRLEHAGVLNFSLFEDDSPYPVFVFVRQRLVYWSDYHFTPRHREIEGDYSYRFLTNSKGSFVVVRWPVRVGSDDAEVFYLVPLRLETRVTNQYLRPEVNERLFYNAAFSVHPPLSDGGGLNVLDPSGNALFRIEFQADYGNGNPAFSRSALVISILILLVLVFLLYQATGRIICRWGYGWALIFLVGSVPALRAVMLLSGFPSFIPDFALFDPRYYASSVVNPSLGDLMLNLLGTGGIAFFLFFNYMKLPAYRNLLRASRPTRYLVAAILVVMVFCWLAVHHQLVYSLSFHSRWSMDITGSLQFGGFRLLSFALYLLSGIIFFLIAHPAYRTALRLFPEEPGALLNILVLGGAVFALTGWLADWSVPLLLLVGSGLFLTMYLFRLPDYLSKIQYLTFAYFFFFGIPPAIVGAHAGYEYYMDQAKTDKDRLAGQLLLEKDLFTEYLLGEAAENIRNDVFIQNRIFSPYASKDIIEQKIRRVYLSNYLDQYEIQIYVFNSRGDAFEPGRAGLNYFSLREEFAAYETEQEGLYFINQLDRSAVNRYLCFIELRRYSQVAGYVLISLRLKRFFQNALYPLLLADSRYAMVSAGMPWLSYAIFDGEAVLSNVGDFNYRTDLSKPILQNPRLYSGGLIADGYQHIGFRSSDDKSIIIGSRIYPFRNFLANVSFYFLIYVISVLFLLIVLALYSWISRVPQNYATRIQLYLNFAFFMPLLVISITTLSVIVRAYQQDMVDRHMQRAINLSVRLANTLSDYINQIGDRELLSNEIYDIAQYAELDINLFNRSGRLLASSQPLIYDNEILSYYINPEAYKVLVENQGSNVTLEERVGSLRYKSAYVSINSFDDGSLLGILSVPFFTSSQDLEKNISGVFSTILIIFTVVFMVFLIISYLTSETLTFPLRLITQKIRRTTLSGYNEPLSWNAEDEIGLMVKEYNAMLINLEQSKMALARSEKESAWREMARQVAHEIKNPLTPMQLTLQHMRRRLAAGDEEDPGNKKKQIDLLLEQIHTLSEIANSFSEFAKMPSPQSEQVDLPALLREVAELYGKKELGDILLEAPQGPLYVEGDKKWISRALSNMVINGLQSAQHRNRARIDIRCRETAENSLLVEIEDNGEGIAEEIREKVFLPNFSTKTSGSGLGLAIAKRGIEHAGGRIWFETRLGEGTVFFIEFPLT
jgi:two-component system, NtrC family, nitrogen regulation sensor histidine kinase NtrY